MSEMREIKKDKFEPAYLKLSQAEFKLKIREAFGLLEPCTLCPRQCKKDRMKGELGTCKAGAKPEVSSHNLHHGEEPPLSGWKGSGTIFFTHCNLRCVFCQNYPISHFGHGNQTARPKKLRK